MAINPISLGKSAPNAAQFTVSPIDTETKNIQNQITTKTQSLNRLSADSKLSEEEKAKERQELQKQIAELNRKLRMLRLEKEEEAKKAQEKQKEKMKAINVPPQELQKFFEAGTQLQKERIQLTIQQENETAVNLLEAEIQSDKLYGSDTTAKEEKLHSMIKKKPIEIDVKEEKKPTSFSKEKTPFKVVIKEDDFSPT